MRLVVTGAGGMLGINLCLQQAGRHAVTALTYDVPLRGAAFDSFSVDITDFKAVEKILENAKPDAVIHCAAMADVDSCEKQPDLAKLVNSEAPGFLAEWCAKHAVRMVQISTDAVFDGTRGDYVETDIPNPLSVYAQTKLKAEQNVASVHPDAIIARVNFFGFSPSGKRSLAEFFLNHLRARQVVQGFQDVYFCPLYAGHLCSTLIAMLGKGMSGLFHVVSPSALSKFTFGQKLAERYGLDARLIQPISVKDSGLIAPRSQNLTLKIDKLIQELGYQLPDMSDGIDAFFTAEKDGLATRIKQIAGQ